MSTTDVFDAVVIGAGFGGLGASLALAEAGASVAIREALKYPGGCASTFEKKGARFDAGATLTSGLHSHQLFGRWIERYAPDLPIEWMETIVELRAKGPQGTVTIPITRERQKLVDQIAGSEAGGDSRVRAFFDEQAKTAEVLWRVLDDPTLLPPWDPGALARLAKRAFEFAPLLPLIGRPLSKRLTHFGVENVAKLRVFADALCQITVQCAAAEAETPFAYGAMDYYWRGTAHVPGGIGELAWALWRAIGHLGADTGLKDRVRALVREDGYWRIQTRRGELRAKTVIANLLPGALAQLLGPARPLASPTQKLGTEVARGWGASMMYATATSPAGAPAGAHHLELVGDASRPFTEGNHLFVSISGADEARAPRGERTLTISTHVPLDRAYGPDAGPFLGAVQQAMRATLASCAPEWSDALVTTMTASPRTFERFTGRTGGAVGGIPRRAGLHHYRHLGPHEADRDLWLVGDSVFPGQSALAAATGGVRAAASAAKR